jgi:hypothetical protein
MTLPHQSSGVTVALGTSAAGNHARRPVAGGESGRTHPGEGRSPGWVVDWPAMGLACSVGFLLGVLTCIALYSVVFR